MEILVNRFLILRSSYAGFYCTHSTNVIKNNLSCSLEPVVRKAPHLALTMIVLSTMFALVKYILLTRLKRLKNCKIVKKKVLKPQVFGNFTIFNLFSLVNRIYNDRVFTHAH